MCIMGSLDDSQHIPTSTALEFYYVLNFDWSSLYFYIKII
jgi:hypothetical protein